MAIVLNELKLAKHIIELDGQDKKREDVLGAKPSYTLQLLARYYKQVLHKKNAEIIELLDGIMIRNYKDYNKVLWETKLESFATKSIKNKLNEIDGVGITGKEIQMISSLENTDQEKLVFSMLCYAKLYNMINVKNNNWINVSLTELFKSARVYSKKDYNNKLVINDVKDKYDIEIVNEDTGEIKYEKWITIASLVESTNIKLNFIDDSEEFALIVDDFRELGYTYMKYITSSDSYINCKHCGVLFKNMSKTKPREYCKDHKDFENKDFKTMKCIDCNETFLVDARNMSKCRCDECQKTEKRRLATVRKRRQRVRILECHAVF